MKLGISTWAYSWSLGIGGHRPEKSLTPVEFLESAAGLGLELVQIADNLPLHELGETERAEVASHAAGLGITVEVGTRGLRPDNLDTYLRIARQFKSKILRVVVDSQGFEPSPREIIEITRAFLPKLEDANVILAIENHDRFKSETLRDIIRTLNSDYVGICLDTVNSFGALEGTDVVVEALGPYTVNLHVKDFEIRRVPSNLGFSITGTPAGRGMLDVPKVCRKLKEYGRDVNAVLELWTAPEDKIEATLVKEARWREESIKYLRQVIPS